MSAIATHYVYLHSAGLGQNLGWKVTVDSQTSSLSSVTTSYAVPKILSMTPSVGDTDGGTSITIKGTDLGVRVSNAYLEVLFDGSAIEVDSTGLTVLYTAQQVWESVSRTPSTQH
jgi:hypothetical protein